MFLLSFALRSLRWRLMLQAAHPVSVPTAFWATMVGYLGNCYLPARAGELLRTFQLGRHARMSRAFILGTVAAERVMDGVVLVLLTGWSLTRLEDFPVWLANATLTIGAGLALFVLGLVAAPQFVRIPGVSSRLERITARYPLALRIAAIIERFLEGSRTLRSLPVGAGFLALTPLCWLMDGLAIHMVSQCLNLSLTPEQVIFIMGALGLASAAPAMPGHLGVYQFVAVTLMTPMGYTDTQALAFIVAYQLSGYTIVTSTGPIGLWRLGWRRNDRVP